MEQKIKDLCIGLFEKWSGEAAESFVALPPSGSDRHYFRIKGGGKTAIAALNKDKKENLAFITFSRHFKKADFNVPEIYLTDEANDLYLQEDLGDETLFSLLSRLRGDSKTFPETIVPVYKEILSTLPHFQISAAKDLDYSVCYPRSHFDRQSMMWDLNYFKYYFLKLAKISFDEQELENDFQTFCDYLLKSDDEYFLYRDFQSRNIMLKDDKTWFIDYQGGRKGALQYDLASLIYDAKAHIPQNLRQEFLEHYIKELNKIHPVDSKLFRSRYYAFVLIRIMQAMGAYGFRGFYEKKEHFLLSIPYALDNLEWILNNIDLPLEIPNLLNVLKKLPKSKYLRSLSISPSPLSIDVASFSYKRGIPIDTSGHGGGYVFDCRAIENPGKLEKFKHKTGLNPEVADYLNNLESSKLFFDSIKNLADIHIKKYMERKFEHLMLNFGCTGGQHRSVYFAQRLGDYIKSKYNLKVTIRHIEQEMKK